jgi:hypothetical protein
MSEWGRARPDNVNPRAHAINYKNVPGVSYQQSRAHLGFKNNKSAPLSCKIPSEPVWSSSWEIRKSTDSPASGNPGGADMT